MGAKRSPIETKLPGKGFSEIRVEEEAASWSDRESFSPMESHWLSSGGNGTR
jgi:hypothetical protein